MRKQPVNPPTFAADDPASVASTKPENAPIHTDCAAIGQALAERRMATPVMLFLVGHRPLAFAVGQILHAVQPLAGLLEIELCGELADLLSDPHGIDHIEDMLSGA